MNNALINFKVNYYYNTRLFDMLKPFNFFKQYNKVYFNINININNIKNKKSFNNLKFV